MSQDFAHCLRPTFTESLVKTLKEGCSLNLIGESGQGRWRLLEDVKKCHLRNTLILAVNMKGYKQSYDGFVQALRQQAGETASGDLGSLLTALEQRSQQIVFWLHDFDALLNNPEIDERYNEHFIDSLNSIKNRSHQSLVCVTSKSRRKYVLIIRGSPRVSPLDLNDESLPKLGFMEIKYELKNQDLSLNSDELAQVTSTIHQQKMPYRLLVHIVKNLHNQVEAELPLLQRLDKWKKEFWELQPTVTNTSWWHKFSVNIQTWCLVFKPLIVPFRKIKEFVERVLKCILSCWKS